MSKIKFKIVTPERVVYENEIDQVTLPTLEGEITVLPNHVPLMSLLKAGELTLKKESEIMHLAVSFGFVQVNKNEVIVLADTAERSEEIDIARAEQARKRAEELVKEAKNKEDVSYTALVSKMEKELARIRVSARSRAGRQRQHARPISES